MPSPTEIQTSILRHMTPEQKLRAATQLFWSAWGLKEAYVQSMHPEWTAKEVNEEVKRWMRSGTE